MKRADRVNYRLRRLWKVERKYAKMLFETAGVVGIRSSEKGIEVLAYSDRGNLPDRLDGFPIAVFEADEDLSDACGCSECSEIQANIAVAQATKWCN